ncbi:T-cell surface glycoprotein CD3 epsilon chain [Hyperolius riggenbachi]|uniref:T-cell surface glycoprotein CD3 epsilon chain n=1 Tax=Hyperolius riggenbachi TaxID=752182 RepID=UPI0035A31039
MKTQLLVFFLLASADVSFTDEGNKHQFQVVVTGTSVNFNCPLGTDLKQDGKKDTIPMPLQNVTVGTYYCTDDSKTAYLYFNVYTCENCMELSVSMVAGIVIADILVTIGVSFLVYFGCKRKSPRNSQVANGGRKRAMNNEHPPPVPHPDYEPLQQGRRQIYDDLNRNNK